MDLLEIEKKSELKSMGKKYRKNNIQEMAENKFCFVFFSAWKRQEKRTQSNSPQINGREAGCHRALCLLWDGDKKSCH